MSVVVRRKSSSYSTRSVGGSSGVSLSGGMQFSAFGGGRSRMSSASLVSTSRARSVYGGAGGYGTSISQSVFSASPMSYSEIDVCGNEKLTMQNLNDRLASYLEKVRTLEAANRKLELQIKTFYEKRSPVHSKDLTLFFSTISELREQLLRKFKAHHQMTLQVDNARLAANDFKMKYETELNMRMLVEADLANLRRVLDSLTLARTDLEVQVEGLKEELVYLKRNHEEEMSLMWAQQSGAVNVEIDCAESTDLNLVLSEMREQYEALVLKNQREVDKWFQNKVDVLQTQITTSTTEVTTYQSEVTDLKRSQQSLEIELQGQLSKKQYLERGVAEVSDSYSIKLSQLQLHINTLEAELQQLTISIQQQSVDYQLLLDIKMRLELEIVEYRRLLDGEAHHRGVIISTVREEVKVKVKEVKEEVVEEYKPHIERRVKTIVEEIIDGKVVSSTVDTQVEDIQKASREVKVTKRIV